MITESALYWIIKLDDIRTFLIVCTIFLGFVSAVLLLMTITQNTNAPIFTDSDWRKMLPARISTYIAAITFGIALVLVPSTKQMAAIKGIPAIVNSDMAKDMSSDAKELYKLGVDALKEKLTDTNSNKEK